MSLFYNPTGPTPTTSNSINNVSIDIRDFLLNQNISSTYPSVSTAVNGSPHIGQPVLDTESNHLNYYPHQQLDLNTTGLDILGSVLNGQGVGIGNNGSLTPNFDVRSSLAGRVLGATGLLNDTKIGTIGAQQLALALANNAAFNVEQSLLGSLNIQDNVLALVKGAPLPGFRPSYQITVASGTLGTVADFAGKMLGFTIPRSYLNDDGSIFQPENNDAENIARANSMILNTGNGQVLALLANARANLDVNSSDSPFRSGYAPGYTNNKGILEITNSKLYGFSSDNNNFDKILALSDGIIPDLSYVREYKVSSAGFESPEQKDFVGHRSNKGYNERLVNDMGFSWGSIVDSTVNVNGDYSPIIGDKKSLLVKTQKLFDSVGMQNIITAKGDMNKNSSQLSQANGGGFSKGNAVMNKNSFQNGYYNGTKDTAENTYCRSWTTIDRYDKIGKLVRSGSGDGESINGLYGSDKVNYRDTPGSSIGSVLDKYGKPKITPYTTDSPTDLKQYMFSIENLAWADRITDLPLYEIGDGDIINNKKGRIMWFPPYDINFSESNNVSWESTNFIGRGEPIYTYNNTERSGNLSFKVVVDHPSYANSFRGNSGPDDHYINSFWAGCIPPEFKDKLTVSEESWVDTVTYTTPQKITPTPEIAPDVNLVVYFPNDNITLPDVEINGRYYENGLTIAGPIDYNVNTEGYTYGVGNYHGLFTKGIHLKTGWEDRTNYGLNGNSYYSSFIEFDGNRYNNWQDIGTLLPAIETWLKEKCQHCVCNVTGFASQQGNPTSNDNLVTGRADAIVNVLITKLFQFLPENERVNRFRKHKGPIPNNPACLPGDDAAIDKRPCKLDRRAEITFEVDKSFVAEDIQLPNKVEDIVNLQYNKKITDRFYNETLYFDQLTDADPLVFDSFRQKIKYFHPAFHSTTPEGLNSRLNFLLQCTRQGPTSESQGPNNLAFGRPPVCVLRIGDFYNTKIIMDSVNIDYEPLVWDLNPEGIGVQPMIANVTIAFKFIGGSSLMGPINKLQNALSFNYFANTQVYDARADYISKDKDPNLINTTNFTQDFSVYCLHDGIVSRTNIKEDIINLHLSPPNIDEVTTQDIALVGVEEAPLTVAPITITDMDKKIELIVNFFENSFDTTLGNMSGSFIVDITIPEGLSKEYTFKVIVFDNKNLPVEIGIGILTTETTQQKFDFTKILNKDYFGLTKSSPHQGKINIIDLKTIPYITNF